MLPPPIQEMVLTAVTELQRIPWRLTFIAMLGGEHYCIGIFECHLVLADVLLQRQTFSTKERYGLGKMTMTHLLGHMHHWYLYEGRSHHVICC